MVLNNPCEFEMLKLEYSCICICDIRGYMGGEKQKLYNRWATNIKVETESKNYMGDKG